MSTLPTAAASDSSAERESSVSDLPGRLTVALSDRYRLEGRLGEGGMATVYLAEDLKHKRRVAVKVLRPELAALLGPERFLREIETTANLHHPHILPLYDSGEADGYLYYVMPYVEGESLRDRLNREKQLPIADALQIAREVAEALGYAHGRWVIHRDIKPDNIMLEQGHAAVADFGIARAVSTAGAEKLTRTGMAIGTPSYMSPEQSSGEGDIDGRSDLYALGCVLYEMLGGEPPYSGPTAQAIIAKRLMEPVPRISTLRETVPPALEAALIRVLAKAPADRFTTAAEFSAALQIPLRTSGIHHEGVDSTVSVAVLPFANMSADPADEFFADGMTEEIINVLAHLPGLRVAARTSCFAFKGKTEDLRVVAEKLGVGSVMEGSVRKAGARLRVTAQLINAADGCHLWSERYDRELVDAFALQDEIAGAIAAKLQLSLTGRPTPRAAPAMPEAYGLLLKGRVLLNRRGRAILESRVCLERAVALDPGNAEGHALLGDCYRLYAMYGIAPATEMMPQARAAAERALALDPGQVEALATLANIAATYDRDLAASLAFADRALARDPAHVWAMCERAIWRSMLEAPSEGFEECLRDLRTARGIDPLNAWAAAMQAIGLFFAGRPDEALAAAREAVELAPDLFTARWTVVLTLAGLGRHEEALAAAEPALVMSARNSRILTEVAAVHAARGDMEGAETVYQEIRGRSRTEYVGWAEHGAIAASAGHLEEARSLVRKAVDGREVYTMFWKLAAWAPLRADAEGERILRSTTL